MNSGLVRQATAADVEELSLLLQQAFKENPFHRWLYASEDDWKGKSHRSFAVVLRPRIRKGTVWTTQERIGAALWDAPGTTPGVLSQLSLGLKMLPLLGARLPEAARAMRVIADMRSREPHWYLAVLATRVDSQRRGFGALLLSHTLHKADEAGVPVCTETSDPRNLPFYKRFGFVVSDEVTVSNGPVVWSLRRSPRRS